MHNVVKKKAGSDMVAVMVIKYAYHFFEIKYAYHFYHTRGLFKSQGVKRKYMFSIQKN